VLFLHNDPTAPEALLGEVFAEAGFDVSTFSVVPPDRPNDPALDVAFPDPLAYDVIVPLGARWAAYDDSVPWLAGGIGVLGVCFGGQLLARALGGSVGRSPAPEIGWCEVDSDDATMVPGGPWFQWHFDRLTPPPGATELARNGSATQAFVQGRALGLQFHPEVDVALVEQWIAEDHGGDMTRLGLDAGDLRARTVALADDAAGRLRLLVKGFVGLLADDALHGAQGLR
jgi:GMP synthase-like glutamine amidotransferase